MLENVIRITRKKFRRSEYNRKIFKIHDVTRQNRIRANGASISPAVNSIGLFDDHFIAALLPPKRGSIKPMLMLARLARIIAL